MVQVFLVSVSFYDEAQVLLYDAEEAVPFSSPVLYVVEEAAVLLCALAVVAEQLPLYSY